ncbi:hypothetical protein Hanom_Chr01g00044851 [Helianthus anomalus]
MDCFGLVIILMGVRMIEDFVVMVCFCCFCYMSLVFMVEFRMIEDFVVMFIGCICRFGDKFGLCFVCTHFILYVHLLLMLVYDSSISVGTHMYDRMADQKRAGFLLFVRNLTRHYGMMLRLLICQSEIRLG